MKRSIISCFLLLISLQSYAQKLVYESSFEKATEIAQKTGKKVLVHIAPNLENNPPPANVSIKMPLMIEEPESVQIIHNNFILYKVMDDSDAGKGFIRDYSINVYPSFLFFHANGDLFHTFSARQASIGNYGKAMQNAVNKSKSPTLTELKNEIIENPTNKLLIDNLIEKRKGLGIHDNTDILDVFSKNLKREDFNDYKTVLFILENGPYLDSRAYRLAYSNPKIIDSIYRFESSEKRVAINNAIINNSMNSAIKEKNTARAIYTADFIKSTWHSNPSQGIKNANYRILAYRFAVQDTANYLREVFKYVDTYILYKDIDEVKSEAENRLAQVVAQEKRNNPEIDFITQREADSLRSKNVSNEEFDKLVKAGGKVTTTNKLYAVIPSSAGSELNKYASEVYKTGTLNKVHLEHARIWMEKAIEINPRSIHYDTLALILYRLGSKTEAMEMENKAISASKDENRNPSKYIETLKKMQSDSL